ncbi:hypothetical protein PPYR_12975 [Photinus pyralis]|uniref:U3 small nucleolar RNA-associated protein 14 homolog A n=2 Tax=Photinus pyralis TaxID=7054 RepID=A0A1Y1L0D9_PHOPY|nr:U3 small nucleolar RNA-associated protein 14 homolog A-like [Photinus pyralis]XP_031355579.1 U3 small nucleolar RNA-associated protein 14 homolog A-like [Photinus pyralis]KAB0793348.1 hypothetical protein PPYR_12968 [Photinus pyralis]KAB0793355.1 hypothetical protein PPYR_12975 [Photinus pyralis]
MTAGKGQLVKNVLNLNKKVVYPKPSRTEPRREVSEFNLAPSEKGKSNVRVTDLTDALKKQSKQAGVRQRIRSFEKKVKPLPKPLEKVKADRIRRSTAFDKVKKHLNRWNAVVTSNRASNHLTFPLQDDLKLESGKNFTTFRIKSDLQKRLETFEEPGEVFNLESEPKYPLTMQEMLERRKEMKKMKIIESQKAAKARRQNKIKSKKYHRIQRREKIKGQIKEFEGLQQTNPDEALKKLDEIERVRAEERASLRHRNTGKWAKSKQIKAKYDSTNRQELAQQLMISRELTQKVQADDDRSESEDENVPKAPTVNNDNPWVNQIKTSEEVETFLKGYRKFWEEKNATKTEASAVVEADASAVVEAEAMKSNADVAVEEEESNTVVETEVEIVNLAKEDVGASVPEETDQPSQKREVDPKKKVLKTRKRKNSHRTVCLATTQWEVGILSDTEDECEDIDALFDRYSDNFKRKLDVVKQSVKVSKKAKPKQKVKKMKSNSEDLSFKMEAKRPIIDEPLDENMEGVQQEKENALSFALRHDPRTDGAQSKKNIDPNDIICTKPTDLQTELPDLLNMDDNEEDDDQRGAIVEAFQDDDIVESFEREKRDEIEGEKPKDIDLSLPGWGSWGGPGVVQSKKKQRKNRRFIVKFPKEFKRRDDNKGNLIINEKADEKVKKHLVSDVPFPFKTVKDFEASIRAPVGSTFVPETAFRRMIKPAVTTKAGAVIRPMTEEILLKKKG